jgi:hypothetical protein
MPYDYSYKKPLDELRYYYVRNIESPYDEWCFTQVIQPALEAVREEYGITFKQLKADSLPHAPQPGELIYVVYGPTNPLAMKPHERDYLAALARHGCKANIISAYPLSKAGRDKADYRRAKMIVPNLCAEIGINAVFPDDVNTVVGIRTIDWEDLRDNIVGETIRIKYNPTLSNRPEDLDLLRRMQDQHVDDISYLAELYRKNHLWQRAVTDGSILFTHDGYWYSSQTKTDKTVMTVNDYSLITFYDEWRRAVTYSGRKLPSSDVPEHLLLSSLLSMHGKRPNIIVHFHHYELTRGALYKRFVTHKKLEYGKFDSGRLLLKDMRDKMTVWLIMKEHGLIWTGDTLNDFEAFLHTINAPAFVIKET